MDGSLQLKFYFFVSIAALNRGRHLYSAGRPSRWALAHISSYLLSFIGVSLTVWLKSWSFEFIFGRPFVKRFALCYLTVVCLSCLSVLSCPVCNVGVLWPNGWMDRDETLHAGRPRPWLHCVRWGPPRLLQKGHSPQFSAHICCGQIALNL